MCFGERGFENATMREIAKAAEVAVGAAYYYFESKDAIVMAFYERSQEEMRPQIEVQLDKSKTSRDAGSGRSFRPSFSALVRTEAAGGSVGACQSGASAFAVQPGDGGDSRAGPEFL